MGQDVVLCTYGPPGERKRMWILKFEDTDKGDMHFHDEDEAIKMFRRCADAWTCTLFVTAEMAAGVGFEPTHAGVKGPRLKPLGDPAIKETTTVWPCTGCPRIWKKAQHLCPVCGHECREIEAIIEMAPPGGLEPPSPP